MALKDWYESVEDEFYNERTNTRINIIQENAGYKVKITNMNTNSSSWKYKTTWEKKDALKFAKAYMRSH